jgi:hypothetical protein
MSHCPGPIFRFISGKTSWSFAPSLSGALEATTAKRVFDVVIGIILTQLQHYGASCILFTMKNKPKALSPHEKFKRAMASVLSTHLRRK